MESIERLLFESFWSKFQPLRGGCWRSLGQCWSYLSSPRGSLGDNEPNLPPGDLPATPCNPKYPSQRQGKAEMFGRTLSRTFYRRQKNPLPKNKSDLENFTFSTLSEVACWVWKCVALRQGKVDFSGYIKCLILTDLDKVWGCRWCGFYPGSCIPGFSRGPAAGAGGQKL